jgi:hypothetical protein
VLGWSYFNWPDTGPYSCFATGALVASPQCVQNHLQNHRGRSLYPWPCIRACNGGKVGIGRHSEHAVYLRDRFEFEQITRPDRAWMTLQLDNDIAANRKEKVETSHEDAHGRVLESFADWQQTAARLSRTAEVSRSKPTAGV